MRDLMKLKETEKSELERMTLNKSEMGQGNSMMMGGTLGDNLKGSRSKIGWSA